MAQHEEWSEPMDADEETQKICDDVKSLLKKKDNYVKYKAVKYRDCSVENGKKYLFKVHVGGDNYIHLSVLKKCKRCTYLLGVQENKAKDDSLKPF